MKLIFSNEVEVQFYYTSIFCQLGFSFSARFNTDGIYEKQNLKILAEYKLKGNLNTDRFRGKCLCQSLGYLKKIEKSGERLPELIFICTGSYFCFVETYLLEDSFRITPDDIPPSLLFKSPPLDLLSSVSKLHIPIYDSNNITDIGNILSNYSSSKRLSIQVSEGNLVRVFESFITSNIVVSELDEHEQVALFASVIFGECSNVEGKRNLIVAPLTNNPIVKINRENYDSFIESISCIERPSSKREIISKSDMLIEEVTRRFLGEFYTPKVWVDEAHSLLEDCLGVKWREEFVVWDPCCGTGNLTRDYWFKDLFCSTLNQSDLDIMIQRKYNPEAAKFQYDFLNEGVLRVGEAPLFDSLEHKAPKLLESLRDNRPLLFLMNPPFVAPTKMKERRFSTKGCSENSIKDTMSKLHLGKAINQVLCQFLFKCLAIKLHFNLDNVVIACFAPPVFLRSSGFKKFREFFNSSFKLESSFLFNSSEFSNVSDYFGVLFGIWKSGTDNRSLWVTNVKERKYNRVENSKLCLIYNTDQLESIFDWYNQETKESPKVPGLLVSNALKVKNDDFTFQDAIGFLNITGFTGPYVTSSKTIQSRKVTKDNLYVCSAIFTCYDLNIIDWSYLHNPFLKPVESDELEQWLRDSLVNFLFSNQARQDSMRNLLFNTKNIVNHFFWIPKSIMEQEADRTGFDEMYQDCISFGEDRFLSQVIQGLELSSLAKEVLDIATNLTILSVEKRKELHEINPSFHLHCWDAGWFQIRKVLSKYFREELKDFTKKLGELRNYLREGIYSHGFLL